MKLCERCKTAPAASARASYCTECCRIQRRLGMGAGGFNYDKSRAYYITQEVQRGAFRERK